MHPEEDNPASWQLADLYQRALICKTFPAYKLSDIDGLKYTEIMWAMRLLDVAQQAES